MWPQTPPEPVLIPNVSHVWKTHMSFEKINGFKQNVQKVHNWMCIGKACGAFPFCRMATLVKHTRHLLCFVSMMYCGSLMAGKFNKTDFLRTLKPMHCHSLDVYTVRSNVECVLHCRANLYSCLGYSVTRHLPSVVRCHVCFIYDVRAPMIVAPNVRDGVTSFMPVWNTQVAPFTNMV